jgi:hypothetical protein
MWNEISSKLSFFTCVFQIKLLLFHNKIKYCYMNNPIQNLDQVMWPILNLVMGHKFTKPSIMPISIHCITSVINPLESI